MASELIRRAELCRSGDWSFVSSHRALKGMPLKLQINQQCEERLLSVFSSLRRCRDCGPHTKSEIYLGTIRGQMVFLPGPPFRLLHPGGWQLHLESLHVSDTHSMFQHKQYCSHGCNIVLGQASSHLKAKLTTKSRFFPCWNFPCESSGRP